jgi:hypothetical protein
MRLEGLGQLKNPVSHRDWNPRSAGLWCSASINYATAVGGKLVLVPLRPPQIPHDLTWDRTLAATVRRRRAINRLS